MFCLVYTLPLFFPLFLCILFPRRLPVLETTAGEIASQTGNPVLPVQMDVRNPDAVKAAFDACEAKFGLPNIVINNAAGNFISVSCILCVWVLRQRN